MPFLCTFHKNPDSHLYKNKVIYLTYLLDHIMVIYLIYRVSYVHNLVRTTGKGKKAR